MYFHIKDNINLEELRKYGFELGRILKEKEPYNEILDGCSYKDNWWLYFYIPIDEYSGEYVNDDCGLYHPVSAWVDTRDNKNILWFDTMPYCTYHMEMDELNPMVDIIYQLVSDGMIEKMESNVL